MAGHSKWANIRHRKGAQDAKRGKIFTKLIREITVAARMGGADEDANPRLRDVLLKAYKANMKKDTIENAIKRGAGGLEGDDMVEMTYEGYAPCGVAVLVNCLSDNKNRTVSEVRHAFSKCGGNLGTGGSVSYLFTKEGQISFSLDINEEALMEVALDLGALDILSQEESIDVICAEKDYHRIQSALIEKGFKPEESELTMSAQTMVPIMDVDSATKVLRLVDMLEDLDDVQTVYTNADISSEIIEQL